MKTENGMVWSSQPETGLRVYSSFLVCESVGFPKGFSFLKIIFSRLILIACWLKRFYKFLDSFIQSLCKFDVVLPSLKKMVLHSKMHFGYNSTQKLLQNLESLEYLGPLEMLPKLSKGDIADLVTWVKENNWRTVLHHNTRDEWISKLNKNSYHCLDKQILLVFCLVVQTHSVIIIFERKKIFT